MSGLKCTPGIDRAPDMAGTAKNELIRQCVDLAEPEHKMYCLTADIIYEITNAIKQ